MKRSGKIIALIVTSLGMLLVQSSCKKEVVEEPYTPTPYTIATPYGFPEMSVSEDNPLTVEGVALGRKLYYDPIIDKNQGRSCSGCHDQSKAFTTVLTTGQVLPHMNLGYNTSFLWDGKIQGTMEDIMMFEVGEFFETNVSNLNGDDEYPHLFKQAFDVDEISQKEVAYALAQFFRTMISSDSKLDQFYQGKYTLTQEEFNGMAIFNTERGDCFHCHGTILFTDNKFHNNGLDAAPVDPGYAKTSGHSFDHGKWKTPSLRNVEHTSPYMHDGRFTTLEEVVEFYSSGLQHSTTIDPLMKGVDNGGLQLSSTEKTELVAFLKCLSDSTFLNNPNLKKP